MESRETEKPIKSGAPAGAEEGSLIKRSKHVHVHFQKNSGIQTLSQTGSSPKCGFGVATRDFQADSKVEGHLKVAK
jgi:hypothetical protein